MIKNLLYLIAEAIIFIIIIMCVNDYKSNQVTLLEQNLKATKDSIETIRLKNNQLVYEKSLYISNNDLLLELLNISNAELKDLKKKVGELELLANTNSMIKYDTIHTTKDSIIYINDNIINKFTYNDKWLSFNGESIIINDSSNTILYNISIPTPLKVGLTSDYNIFVIPENPYMTVTSIEGAILDKSKLLPKKQHWSHGFYVGFGVQYGLCNKEFDIGPQFGYSLQYNF